MAAQLVVAGLPPGAHVGGRDLQQAFGDGGELLGRTVLRGCGLLRIGEADARDKLGRLTWIRGHPVEVIEVSPRTACTLAVCGLLPGTTEQRLKRLFKQFGEVASVQIGHPRSAWHNVPLRPHTRTGAHGLVTFALEVGAWRALTSPSASLRLGFSQVYVEPWSLLPAARARAGGGADWLGAAEKFERPEDTSDVDASWLYACLPCCFPFESPDQKAPGWGGGAVKAVPMSLPMSVLPGDLSVPREGAALRGTAFTYTLHVPCFAQEFLLGRTGSRSGLLSDQGREQLQLAAGVKITDLCCVKGLCQTEPALNVFVGGSASRCRCPENGPSVLLILEMEGAAEGLARALQILLYALREYTTLNNSVESAKQNEKTLSIDPRVTVQGVRFEYTA